MPEEGGEEYSYEGHEEENVYRKELKLTTNAPKSASAAAMWLPKNPMFPIRMMMSWKARYPIAIQTIAARIAHITSKMV